MSALDYLASLGAGTYGRQVGLVRYKREWRAAFVDGQPGHHLSFAGIYFYGGKNLKEAKADVERICSKWGWEYVGRIDKREGGAVA
jgi:hypothetical protein